MHLSTYFWPCQNHWKHEIAPLNQAAGVNGAVQGWMSGPGCLSITVTDCRPALPCWLTVGVLETPLSLPILGRIPDRHACRFQLLADCSVCWLDCRGCYSHTGGSANPLGCPAEREWWWPGATGFAEQQIETNWTPPERGASIHDQENDCDPASSLRCDHWEGSVTSICPQGRKKKKKSTSPSSSSSSSPSSSSPSGCALGAGSEVMTWQKWINSPHIDCEVTWHVGFRAHHKVAVHPMTTYRTVGLSCHRWRLYICGAEDEIRKNLQ